MLLGELDHLSELKSQLPVMEESVRLSSGSLHEFRKSLRGLVLNLVENRKDDLELWSRELRRVRLSLLDDL